MLVRRHAYSARGLLFAAAAAALISTTLLAALAAYGEVVVDAGRRAAVATAPADERAVQVRLPSRVNGGNVWSVSEDDVDKDRLLAQWSTTDTKLRQTFADRFDDDGLVVSAAGYATGIRFAGDTGKAVPDSDGNVYARVMFLDRLAEHTRLVSGTWPAAGASPRQIVVGEAAAQSLGLRAGSVVPLANGVTKRLEKVIVSGVFAVLHTDDPYWLLAPEAVQGVEAGRNTYGPLVLNQEDFFDGWAQLGTNGWVVTTDLSRAGPSELASAAAVARTLSEVPKDLGYDNGGQAFTGLDRLVDRIQQASLVGRSDLLMPVLLIAILGGYVLFLLAARLTEGRRQQAALLRARGASRAQLAGLAAGEALLVAVPAAVLAPLLAAPLLGLVSQLPVVSAVGLKLEAGIAPVSVTVAVASGVGCALAMLLPALRGGGTYAAELAAVSRPSRAAVAQRTGLDIALVGFAVLAWFQLQQYTSPLLGNGSGLGIDPMLTAAGPLGVLAGAVVALRLFPLLTRLLERVADRRPWFAAQLAVWQAGRRPHAGPVLLLALSVAVSTLAWTLAATVERSQVDQADQATGADLRLSAVAGALQPLQGDQIAALPGVVRAVPGWQTSVRIGEHATVTSVVAVDAAASGGLLRLRGDLGDVRTLLADVAAAGQRMPGIDLPVGTVTLGGAVDVTVADKKWGDDPRTATAVWFTDEHGVSYTRRLQAGRTSNEFTVSVPPGLGMRLTGFSVDGPGLPIRTLIRWTLTGLAAVNASGEAVPLNLDARSEKWSMPAEDPAYTVATYDDRIQVDAWVGSMTSAYFNGAKPRFMVTLRRQAPERVTVPALATPGALAALHTQAGQALDVPLWFGSVRIRIVGVAQALPGRAESSALLLDMPSLGAHFQRTGLRPPDVDEWWVATDPDRHAQAAAAAALLPRVRITDRRALAALAGQNPFGVGGRVALFIAAFGAIGLALVGIAVDVRATARRRVSESAVLSTLGVGPGLLARALMIEQAFLAGLGVVVGLLVGLLVARTTGPLVILTPSASRPVPPALTTTDWLPVLGTAAV
ncbi:FtsX-like permease family protein, partial [Catellatospora citrea]